MANRQGKQYEIDMCNGPILSRMLRFSIPLMCSSVLQLLFNAADIVVVGRWAGDNSLAAVGSNTALIGLLTNLFVGLAVGANTLAAKYYGAHDQEELRKTVHTSMLLSLISGLILTVVGVVGARTILIWMQTPANVLDLATLYLRIYFLGMTATMVYNFGSALLRAEGDTQRPLYFLSLAGVVNIILNLFFVIVMKLDVAGVAIATVISQCISASLVVRCMVKDLGPLHLDLRQLRLHKKTLDPAHRPPRRVPGNLVLPLQRGDPVLCQLLRGNHYGRQLRRRQHRAVCLRLHERSVSGNHLLHQPEPGCGKLSPHPQNHDPGPALCPGGGDPAGQRRHPLRPHPFEHLLPQSGGH